MKIGGYIPGAKAPLLPTQVVRPEKGLAREFSPHSPCKRSTVTHHTLKKGKPYRIERMYERVSSYFPEYRDISSFFRGSRLVRIGVGRSHGLGACTDRATLYTKVATNYTLSYRVPPCTLSFFSLRVRFLALYESRRKFSLLFPLPQHRHG